MPGYSSKGGCCSISDDLSCSSLFWLEFQWRVTVIFKAFMSSYIPPPYFFILNISLPLLWINIMLYFICMNFAELWATGSKRQIKNEYMPPTGIEPATPRFPRTEICQGTFEIVLQTVLWSIWGSNQNVIKYPSLNCYMAIWDMIIYSDTLNWSDITPICELITKLDFITDFDLFSKFREVSIEHCNGCG